MCSPCLSFVSITTLYNLIFFLSRILYNLNVFLQGGADLDSLMSLGLYQYYSILWNEESKKKKPLHNIYNDRSKNSENLVHIPLIFFCYCITTETLCLSSKWISRRALSLKIISSFARLYLCFMNHIWFFVFKNLFICYLCINLLVCCLLLLFFFCFFFASFFFFFFFVYAICKLNSVLSKLQIAVDCVVQTSQLQRRIYFSWQFQNLADALCPQINLLKFLLLLLLMMNFDEKDLLSEASVNDILFPCEKFNLSSVTWQLLTLQMCWRLLIRISFLA